MKKIITTLLLAVFCFVTQASILVTNGLTHIYEVTKGGIRTDEVILKNVGKSDQRVLIYFKDLRVGCDTLSLNLREPATETRSNANWINVGFEEVVLKAGEEFPLKYEIKVPQNTEEGTFWSALMIEVKDPIDTTKNQTGFQISSNIRYAIQLITTVSTSAEALMEFYDAELVEDNNKAIKVRLSNTCIKLLRPELKLEVYDKEGNLVYNTTGDKRKLYPGQCKDFNLPLDDVPNGSYQAVLIADCGESDLFGMTIDLELNGG